MLLPSIKDSKKIDPGRLGEAVKMTISIRKRDGLVFAGDVYAVSSENEIGPFDILPYHENFISLIARYLIIHLDGGLKKEIEVAKGVLKVKENKLEVFIGW